MSLFGTWPHQARTTTAFFGTNERNPRADKTEETDRTTDSPAPSGGSRIVTPQGTATNSTPIVDHIAITPGVLHILSVGHDLATLLILFVSRYLLVATQFPKVSETG